MQKFYTNENAQLTQTLEQLGRVMALYNQRDFETDTALRALLNLLETSYEREKKDDLKVWIQHLKMEFVTVQRGVNPLTFEKLITGKRDMQSTAYFRILQALYTKIQHQFNQNVERLQEAQVLVTQILIAGLQNGMISTELLQSIQNEQDIERLWKHLSTDSNLLLGQRRVLLMVSRYDGWILMADAINALKNS